MALLSNKDDKIILKFNIIKQGLINEKEKNSKLQIENNALKEEIQINKELIANLQLELNQFMSTPQQQKPIDGIFNALFRTVTDYYDEDQLVLKDNQIKELVQEVVDLKSQIESLKKEKAFINAKLKELVQENTIQATKIEQLKQSHTSSPINNRNSNTNSENSSTEDDNYFIERISTMSAVIQRQDKEKIESERLIEFYEKDQNEKINNIGILYMEQNLLLEEIENLRNEINQLKNDNKENLHLLDAYIPITKKTLFKGKLIKENDSITMGMAPKDIIITFGKKNNWLTIREVGEKDLDVHIDNVSGMKRVENNKLMIIINNKGNTISYCIEFRANQIIYIVKYYYEAKDSTDYLSNSLLKYSLDSGN